MKSSSLGLFVKGRWALMTVLFFTNFLTCAITGVYVITLAKGYQFTSTATKIWLVIAMLFNAFYALFTFASIHSLWVETQKVGFGLFTVFGLGSGILDIAFFSLAVQGEGFRSVCEEEAKYPCGKANLLIGLSVAIFIGIFFKLYCLFSVWGYEIRSSNNTTTCGPAPAPSPVPMAAPPMSYAPPPSNWTYFSNASAPTVAAPVHPPVVGAPMSYGPGQRTWFSLSKLPLARRVAPAESNARGSGWGMSMLGLGRYQKVETRDEDDIERGQR